MDSASLVFVFVTWTGAPGFAAQQGDFPCEVLHTANSVIGILTCPIGSSLFSPTGQAVHCCCRVAAAAHGPLTACWTGQLMCCGGGACTTLRRAWLWLVGFMLRRAHITSCGQPCVSTRRMHGCYMHVCVAGVVGGRVSVIFPAMFQGSTWMYRC
jgi:hypothetical protein